MNKTNSNYYGVWVHPAGEQAQVWHRPDYIVRSVEPRLVAATGLFQNHNSSAISASAVNHMHVEINDAHRARAVVEYGMDEDGWQVVQPIGNGGEQWAATAILLPADQVKAWKGDFPSVNVVDQLIRAVEWSDIVNARKVLDRIDASKRPQTPGYAAAEAHRQRLVEQARVAHRTDPDQHKRMPNEFVIFDGGDQYDIKEAFFANDTDDVTMTRTRAAFSIEGVQLP